MLLCNIYIEFKSYNKVVVEDLHIANMVKNHALAKSISDAGWGAFITLLRTKADEAACVVIAVNPAGTSQACSWCGAVVHKDLSARWHTCSCGASMQRDVNAARNILQRAGQALRSGPVPA